MLVCSVSLQPPRTLTANIAESAAAADIAAGPTASTFSDIVEIAEAIDIPATEGNIYPTLVDDPASAGDTLDGYLGENMQEAVSASDTADATATAAGANTWNPADKTAGMTLSNGNLTAVGTANQGVRAQLPAASKFYFEVTNAVAVWNGGIGIARTTTNLGTVTINANNAAIVTPASSGNILFNSSTPVSGAALGVFAINDVACVAVDLVNQRIWFRKNAGNWNNNASADPATNVGGINISSVFSAGTAYPLAATAVGTSSQAIANFGASSFAFTQPSGFSNAAVS